MKSCCLDTETEITFVEVGVLNGGSLFMWRNFFGAEARIIGVEFNPLAKKWEADGFEIHIGNQSDPQFWDDFFAAVGDVDVILDDGGHTNEQQIVTTHKCIPHSRDQGMLIVEDTHASYLKSFGNPSEYSFMNYSKRMIDRINSRFPTLHSPDDSHKDTVYSMGVYESIICFNIDREKCFISSQTSNDGISFDAEDFTHQGTKVEKVVHLRGLLNKKFKHLKQFPLIGAAQRFSSIMFFCSTRASNRQKLKNISCSDASRPQGAYAWRESRSDGNGLFQGGALPVPMNRSLSTA